MKIGKSYKKINGRLIFFVLNFFCSHDFIQFIMQDSHIYFLQIAYSSSHIEFSELKNAQFSVAFRK